jgi:hypothetical protein
MRSRRFVSASALLPSQTPTGRGSSGAVEWGQRKVVAVFESASQVGDIYTPIRLGNCWRESATRRPTTCFGSEPGAGVAGGADAPTAGAPFANRGLSAEGPTQQERSR